jgi:hypothetical protein
VVGLSNNEAQNDVLTGLIDARNDAGRRLAVSRWFHTKEEGRVTIDSRGCAHDLEDTVPKHCAALSTPC